MAERDPRPSPEALLRVAAREDHRGRLKIFLGAVPGVGKTWAMLEAAQAHRRAGGEVVVAVVETHGRAETAALAEGLETLPRRRIAHAGHVLEEMDLDAILARRPALALVDELAHSNAPGSRHPKRHMDVAELLEAGIDVWTTLNIQHVESLNDVVAGITRIRVRETVPDSIIDRADAVELVDLTPEDLLRRLREGRIYLPHTAARAMANYFSLGNLTALRELALRRTAQRVDAQLLDHMQAHAIQGPWAAGERVLVCVTPDGGGGGSGEALVRYGRRLADRLRVPWTALHVETAAMLRAGEGARDRVAACLRLAQSLGAEAVTIPGSTVAADILAYAREHNATQIVLGNPGPRPWWRRWRPSVAAALLARAGDIPVHLAPLAPPASASPPPAERAAPPPTAFAWRPYLAALALVAAATLAGEALRAVLAVGNISLAYLMAVLASAITGGLAPSLFACLASVLAYNFLFLPPLYTFTIAAPENVVALFFFAVAAVLVSNLAAAMRAQAVVARQRARTTEELYGFSRKLAAIFTLDDLLWATAYQIAAMLRLRVMLLLPTPDGASVTPRAGYPPEDALDEADLAAAQWCWAHDRPAGRGADTLPGARRLFLPLRTGRGRLGVLGLDSLADEPARGPLLTPDQQRLLDALADQAAVSIERVRLLEDLDRTRMQAEADRLRAALLTSVSHDLRTPLAAIRGAAETVLAYDASLDPPARAELLGSIVTEAARMGRFIANLLDMTRIEAGAVRPAREPVDIGEAIGSAASRSAELLAGHRLVLDIAPGLPLPLLDPVLFEQVLVNLLDNASRYAPPGTAITVQAERAGDAVLLRVQDEGPGIDPAELDRVFEPFHRAPQAHAAPQPGAAGSEDGRPAGTGLGLAICRGFLAAMGASITAANRPHGGAVFTITLRVSPA